ncbi:MAG: STAS domain-containing protein [Mycobacterium sp.]
MPTSLTLDTAHGNDGKYVLIAAGEIDLSNIDTFARALTAAIGEAASSGRRLTVDLGAVKYLDSAAINALFNNAEHIYRLIAHPLLIRVFTVSGLTELTTVEPAPPKTED